MQLIAGLAIATLVLYLRRFRPWPLRWDATDGEVSRSMPGDDLLNAPTFNATRAITIDARPEKIWSWPVQVGVKRGWSSEQVERRAQLGRTAPAAVK